MVHVTTERPNIGSTLGNALGSIGGKIAGQEYGRYQTRQGLDKLRTSSQNASPIEQLYNLIEASTYSPAIGKSLGPLYETLIRNQGAKNAPTAIDQALDTIGGGISSQGRPPAMMGMTTAQQPTEEFQTNAEIAPTESRVPISKQKSGRDIENLSDQFLNQVRPDLFQPSQYGNIPTFDIHTKSALRPEEEAKIRRNMNASGIAPEQQDQVIAKINEDIKNKYNEALKNYDIAQGQQQAVDQKWNVIKQDAPIQLKPFIGNFPTKTQEWLTDKYFQYAASQPINQTPEAVESQAMALLQRDMNQLNAVAQIPSIPPFRQWGDIKKSMDSIKKAYAPLKSAGMQEALLEDAIYNKDAGIEEAHDLVYGDQTNKKVLNDISNVKIGDDRNKYIENVSKQLMKLGPDDDLILARAMVLGNGGEISDFSDALNLAVSNGLELSPFQQAQLQEIQIPRQQPLYEIFTPGKSPSPGFSVGGVAGMIFGHLFNYIRGKK